MSMLELIFSIALLSLMSSVVVYYITDILILVPSDQDKGPFESKNKKIIWVKVFKDDDQTHRIRDERPVNAWDQVRRVFGLYEIIKEDNQELWYVIKDRSSVWECPHCLGFWVSILPGWWVSIVLIENDIVAMLTWVLVVFFISGMNSIITSVIDALYSQNNEGIIMLDEDSYD